MSAETAIVRLHHWFETMRGEAGYTGPVSHWWESSLLYCGASLDWRYEGLISAYVNLYRKTQNLLCLEAAIRAAEDLRRGQLADGRFWNSSFQRGPIEGGTPHEAAVDVGLLELAFLLREIQDERWKIYQEIARRNLFEYHIKLLWNGKAFRDQPDSTTLVPNKNGTIMEALLLYQALCGDNLEVYILGAAELILSAQVHEHGARDGATIHLGTGKHQLAIGIYTARNTAALLHLYQYYPDAKYLEAAQQMGHFLKRLVRADGTIFGCYADSQPILAPLWISPSGDFLRAFLSLQDVDKTGGWDVSAEQISRLLLEMQQANGSLPTAYGLAYKGQSQVAHGLADFRDILPVVGWCDKAFRGLSLLVPEGSKLDFDAAEIAEVGVICQWKGKECHYFENSAMMQLRQKNGKLLFECQKGAAFPKVYDL
jgi:hypothetical protein